MRAQTSFEYVLIIASAIMFVVFVIVILNTGIIPTISNKAANDTAMLLNRTGTCNSTIFENESRSCSGTGIQHRNCTSFGLWSPWTQCYS